MNKSLFVLTGIVLLAVPSVHAQDRGRFAGEAFHGGNFRGASSARSAAYAHNSAFYGSRYRGGYGNRYRGRGRYYYLGGVPYFYPFLDYGFGYPYYGGGFGYGFGYANGFYSDFGGPGYGAGYYDAPFAGGTGPNGADKAPGNGPSLQTAVQRQLAKRGYYKGSIDGDFGDGSRAALRSFQKDNKLKDTGRIDEATLKALGFTDQH